MVDFLVMLWISTGREFGRKLLYLWCRLWAPACTAGERYHIFMFYQHPDVFSSTPFVIHSFWAVVHS